MQLHDTDQTVSVSGGTAIQMTMDANSAIGFSLSIDKLYVHKIESVIREICSNARDSHVEAGKADVPFEIYLPSEISPYLVIKDQGTGLNEADAIKYLSQLYSSSKQNTNKAVGAYGIGAKSPFAISDSYNIECIKDGVKCSFQFFRSGRSLPQLMLLDKSTTDEPNGVAFRIHVRDLQRKKYEDALKTQMFMFEPKPNIDGSAWPYDKPEMTLERGNVRAYRAEDQREFFGAFALEMGGVTYPFKPDSVNPECEQLFKAIQQTLGYNEIVVISVPIGSVEVPGDRERVEYSDFTIENLVKELHSVGDAFTKDKTEEYLKNFSEVKNFLEATILAADFSGEMKYMLPFVRNTDGMENYKEWTMYEKPIINEKGEVVNVTMRFAPCNTERSDFHWTFSAPFFEDTHVVQTTDEKGQKVDKVVKNYNPKYSFSKASVAYNSTKVVLDQYEHIKIWSTGQASRFDNMTVILVDTNSKPVAKTIELWLAEPTTTVSNRNIYVVRCADKSYDFSEFEYILSESLPVNVNIVRLSELKYTKAATDKVSNAAGFRRMPAVLDLFVPETRKTRFDTKPSQIKMSELQEHFKAYDEDNLDESQFFAYGYFDVDTSSIYSDPEHKQKVDMKALSIMTTARYFGKSILLMSKTAAKKYGEIISETGIPNISELSDADKWFKTLSSECKSIWMFILRYQSVTMNSTARENLNYLDDYFYKVAEEIFDVYNPKEYRYNCELRFQNFVNAIHGISYNSTNIRKKFFKDDTEDLQHFKDAISVLFYAKHYPKSQIGRKINNIFRNIQGGYVEERAKSLVEKTKKNNSVPESFTEFLVYTALNTLSESDALKAAIRFEKQRTIFDFSFQN